MTPEPALLPLALKLAYSGFLLVLVPVYWRHYGPTNFLYFCDVALLLTGVGLWWESPLLISMATVGILLPQLFWLLDLASRALGRPISGMTAYMFDATRSRFLRGLSLFHGWLPLLLLWLVAQLGYDPRAWWMWSLLAAVLVLISYLALPPPSPQRGTRPVNVNYVLVREAADLDAALGLARRVPAGVSAGALPAGAPAAASADAGRQMSRISPRRRPSPVAAAGAPPRRRRA
jgi:hypothetical protein